MLRLLLLLLCWSWTEFSAAKDQFEPNLPRAGQLVERWSGDLSKRMGRIRPEIDQDHKLYTLRGEDLPTLHFLKDEQRFSIPGVVATEKPQRHDEQGALRLVYLGSIQTGAMEKNAQIEVIKFHEGRCQLSWKLSVINRGITLRDQQGSLAYDCIAQKRKEHRREAMHLLPNQLLGP